MTGARRATNHDEGVSKSRLFSILRIPVSMISTMRRNIVVARGKFSDPRHIELTKPVPEIRGGEVEVTIRQLPKARTPGVFELIAAFVPGSRSKAEIDQQIHEERDSWDDR
jgi:predicted metal-dependent phosphoesterase TrpH